VASHRESGRAGWQQPLGRQPQGQTSAPPWHGLSPPHAGRGRPWGLGARGQLPARLWAPGVGEGAGRRERRFGGRRLVVPGSSVEMPLSGEAGGFPLGRRGRAAGCSSRSLRVGPVLRRDACGPGSLRAQGWHLRAARAGECRHCRTAPGSACPGGGGRAWGLSRQHASVLCCSLIIAGNVTYLNVSASQLFLRVNRFRGVRGVC